METRTAGPAVAAPRPTLKGHLQIARFDHWFKNVFCIPGMVLAYYYQPEAWDPVRTPVNILLGLLATGIIASSNYVINEVLDAPHDRHHVTKKYRPVPSGKVNVPLAYVQWLVMLVLGIAVALMVSVPLAITLGGLWIMGCVYNIPPVRSKDLTYGDVLSESINNPLRMIAGWYMVTVYAMPPASLLISYWMVGAFFMAVKRFSEYRQIGDPQAAGQYRRSFKFYDEQKLLVSIMFYASMAMLFFGAFIMRYRLELIVSFPLVALVMANYLHLAFRPESPVQNPEGLYREPGLMAAVVATTVVMLAAFFIDMPWLHEIFAPWVRQ